MEKDPIKDTVLESAAHIETKTSRRNAPKSDPGMRIEIIKDLMERQ